MQHEPAIQEFQTGTLFDIYSQFCHMHTLTDFWTVLLLFRYVPDVEIYGVANKNVTIYYLRNSVFENWYWSRCRHLKSLWSNHQSSSDRNCVINVHHSHQLVITVARCACCFIILHGITLQCIHPASVMQFVQGVTTSLHAYETVHAFPVFCIKQCRMRCIQTRAWRASRCVHWWTFWYHVWGLEILSSLYHMLMIVRACCRSICYRACLDKYAVYFKILTQCT